jgi:hypothetical protein
LCRIEPFEGLVRAKKSFLNRVLGVLVGHDDRSGHYVRTTLVQPHEPGKTPLVTLSGKTYEIPLLIRNT